MSNIINTYCYHPIHKYFTMVAQRQIGPDIYPPPNTTDIRPPDVMQGYVQVFDEKEEKWKVVPDHFNRSTVLHHFLFYPPSNDNEPTFPFIYADNLTQPLLEDKYQILMKFFVQLTPLNNFVSPFNAALTFANRLNHLNQRIQELFHNHDKISQYMSVHMFGIPGVDFTHQILKEEIVHEIKRLLDLLFITVTSYDYAAEQNIDLYDCNHKLPIDNFSQLLRPQTDITKYTKLGLKNNLNLLRFINNLHNAYKHDILAMETSNRITEEPRIQTAKFKSKDNLKEIHIFECSFRALIMACNEYITAVLTQTASTLQPNYKILEGTVGKY